MKNITPYEVFYNAFYKAFSKAIDTTGVDALKNTSMFGSNN